MSTPTDTYLGDTARRLVVDAYLDGATDGDIDGMLAALMGSASVKPVATVATAPSVDAPAATRKRRVSLLKRLFGGGK